jgi:hypothetical protein
MSKADVLLDAIGGLRRTVPKVDLGDMTGPPKLAALGSLARPAPAPKVSDWGWKGGKPDEITGTMLATSDLYGPDRRLYRSQMQRQLIDLVERKPDSGLAQNYSRLRSHIPSEAEMNVANDFQRLEKAGVPREWTGKVLSAIYDIGSSERSSPVNMLMLGVSNPKLFGVGKGATGIPKIAQSISDIMRPMTNDQRSAFLSLMPRWPGNLDELGPFAGAVAGLPRLQQEFIRQNAPTLLEKGMSTDQVLTMAKAMMAG